MNIYSWIIIGCWAPFLGYWAYASVGTKRNKTGTLLSIPTASRILLFIAVAAALAVEAHAPHSEVPPAPDPFFAALGCIICASGIAFAVWARYHLGRNWGMPMSEKEDRELVSTGPYAFVRHPIYTGVILGLIGSAAVSGGWWWLIALIGASYFIIAALREEAMLSKELPAGYPEYRARTRMLVPFIW